MVEENAKKEIWPQEREINIEFIHQTDDLWKTLLMDGIKAFYSFNEIQSNCSGRVAQQEIFW